MSDNLFSFFYSILVVFQVRLCFLCANPFSCYPSFPSITTITQILLCTTRVYLIQLTVEESNVVCSEGVVYIYDGLPDFVSSDRHNETHIVAALCDTQATYPITVEATSGFMTVYYQKGHPVQGFNASYQVCNLGRLQTISSF